jgi:hypothetical protein
MSFGHPEFNIAFENTSSFRCTIARCKVRLFHTFYAAVVTVLLLAGSYASRAQLQRFPIPHTAVQKTNAHLNAGGRTKEAAADTLPFWDDFSKPYLGFFADTLRWLDSYSVWVNDGMGINPPTINVATFDGLDSAGRAYNPNEILSTGYTDYLTSIPLDLSEGKISVAERPGVFLSFFYQWRGNAEAPDASDFLEVDFKSIDGTWITAMTIFPGDDPQSTLFYHTILQVSGDEYFHDNFQFRFRSFGRMSGPFDTWNVDYVYLNKDRNINDLSFPDRALSTRLGPLFGKYRSIPRRHFFSNAQLTPPTFEIQNMKNVEASINFRTEGFFSSTDLDTDNTTTYETVIGKATPINITDNVLFANEHRSVRMDTLPDINDPLQFPADPAIDSTLIRLTVALQTNDNIPFNNAPPIEADSTGDYTPNYSPIDFTRNDTLKADYVLSNYFAYDDGVAEYSAGLIESGNLVAYQFEIDTSYTLKQDTLIGFDIYFPPYGLTSNQRIDFFIYHDNDGVPGELWLRIPSKVVTAKGVNQFQRIVFLPALLINEKKFYIGWKAPVSGTALVGLDISNDTGDKIFVNTNDSWYQNQDVRGSLMVRAIFGSGVIDSSVGVEDEVKFAIYPNPSRGNFYIEGPVTDVEIFSLTGQVIPFASEATENRTQISVRDHTPGLYVLRYKTGNKTKSAKIIISRP